MENIRFSMKKLTKKLKEKLEISYYRIKDIFFRKKESSLIIFARESSPENEKHNSQKKKSKIKKARKHRSKN